MEFDKVPSDTIKKLIELQVNISRTHTLDAHQAKSRGKYASPLRNAKPSGKQALFTIMNSRWGTLWRTYPAIIRTTHMAIETTMPTMPPRLSKVMARSTTTTTSWPPSNSRSSHTPAKQSLAWCQEVKKFCLAMASGCPHQNYPLKMPALAPSYGTTNPHLVVPWDPYARTSKFTWATQM